MSAMVSDSREQLLHGVSPLFVAAKTARAFVVPAVLVLFASGGSPFAMLGGTATRVWATIILVFVAVVSLLPYLIFRYTLGVHWRALSHVSLKLSSELYDFSDFGDEAAIHLGIVGRF